MPKKKPIAGRVVVRAAAKRDASQRVVITGIGAATCFGNDVDKFYDTYVPVPCAISTVRATPPPVAADGDARSPSLAKR